ncbi:hypothetical protein GF373_03480 [bacterium]|nr:hypothetical protein [bacterium]
MFRFPDRFFFSPTQNLENLIPVFVGMALLILIAVIFWSLTKRNRTVHHLNLAWNRFFSMANHYELTRKEIFFLKMLLKATNNKEPQRVLTEADQFERLVSTRERKGRTSDLRYIESLRKKLFARTLRHGDKISTTRQIPAGSRLCVNIPGKKSVSINGDLVDVDSRGLLAVFPERKRHCLPLKTNMQLDAIVYIPKHEPVRFSTWVETIIPGPKKMALLGHSNFVVTNSHERFVGPHHWRGKKAAYPSGWVHA